MPMTSFIDLMLKFLLSSLVNWFHLLGIIILFFSNKRLWAILFLT